MALLGEEVVEEWLNRQGYFTIRGIKVGLHEIDILAFKPHLDGHHECRHIEVQVSTNPVSYVSSVPKAIQKKTGVGPNSSKKRTPAQLAQGVHEWIQKKFDHPKKVALRKRLFPGNWTRELVVNAVKYPEELDLFRKAGITIIRFAEIVRQMQQTTFTIKSAAGSDLLTLMMLGKEQTEEDVERARQTGRGSRVPQHRRYAAR